LTKHEENKVVRPIPGKKLLDEKGQVVTPPEGWDFLPAGDAGVTRKVTSKGVFWKVAEKKGRRVFSKGIWAPSETIEWAKRESSAIRSTDEYKTRTAKDRERREKREAGYKKEFQEKVRSFLNFDQRYRELEIKLAEAVTLHAIPVGSGTVARTKMIPIDERAAKAVIAWMRHNTTKYDSMYVERVKGKRREVRRHLAEDSTMLLSSYRKGEEIIENCPLKKVLDKLT